MSDRGGGAPAVSSDTVTGMRKWLEDVGLTDLGSRIGAAAAAVVPVETSEPEAPVVAAAAAEPAVAAGRPRMQARHRIGCWGRQGRLQGRQRWNRIWSGRRRAGHFAEAH